MRRKLLDLKILDRPIMMIFFSSEKILKKINIKFGQLVEFDMKIILNGSNQSYFY
jgi:hypothetical protein